MRDKARYSLIHLVIMAMFLRALLPAGWMPSAMPDGGFSFTICTMDDFSGFIGKDRSPAKNTDDGRQHDVCPFAAAPHFATAVALASIAPPVFQVSGTGPVITEAAGVRRSTYSPQAPRAPPAPV